MIEPPDEPEETIPVDARTTSPPRAQIAAYILGGGASKRLGASKVARSHGGRLVAATLAERFAPFVSTTFVVLKESQRDEVEGLHCIFDARPERGAVYGIRAALEAPGPAWRFVLACDMPDVTAPILADLWDAAHASQAPGACLRRLDRDDPEPFPSLWHADVASRIQASWGMTARDWLQHARLAVRPVSVASASSLVNLNTPEEWRRWSRARNQGSRL